jgi:DNA topoisomerase-1
METMADKWQTLEHNGPLFPAAYEPTNLEVKVSGKAYKLSAEAEEMVYTWAQKNGTPYVLDSVFQINFWKDLKPVLPAELQNSNFPSDWDFSSFNTYITEKKEQKKNRTSEDRKAEKNERDVRKAHYGIATLDNHSVELGNYTIEPPGIFMGRGKHPLRGRWKPRVFPEDVSINLSRGSKAPVAPAGHNWKTVVENKRALWTAMWYEKLTGAQKRILFSVTSFVRQNADQKKFEKAIELANNFGKVNDFIEKKLTSQDKQTRQIATVCHLISKLSIRVGDEKGEDTADTVGATSLRVEHLTLDDTSVTLDFLGKDSIRYHNKVANLDINAIRNLKEFIQGKNKGDLVFDGITSKDINEFLGIVMLKLTAKQFRTATGSTLLANELRKQNVEKSQKMGRKLEAFTEANLEVALKLNHQSAVSTAYENSLDNMKHKVGELKQQLKRIKDEADIEIKKAEITREERQSYANNRWTGAELDQAIRRARKSCKNVRLRWDAKVAKLKERIDSLQTKTTIKEKTKGVALGTSKLNYADPRIPISWCKDNDVEISRIYPVTAQKKFSWAMDVNTDFYKKYPRTK